MPDGCNLYETEADHKQILKSLREGFPANVSKEVMRDKKPMMIAAASGRLLEILEDPARWGHKAIGEFICRRIAGNEAIPESYKRELPSAMAKIIRHTPDSVGFFMHAPKYYGKGATGLVNGLRHPTRGDALAYEILATAALMEKEFSSVNAPGSLRIYAVDRVDYHIKLQASYKNVPLEYLDQPRRGTVEADLFINRYRGLLEPDKVIGVDFKHSRGTTYDNYDMEQLKGIRVALQTGEIHEFCFVSNVKFSQGFKDKVEAINEELRASGKEVKSEFDSRYLTSKEQKISDTSQIKIFENVRYRGT
ncbi:MAG: hypothetical protein N2V75_04620 [Methanophagales archaeon]|nr:hypothetical protein [Methanophagales archaeon]